MSVVLADVARAAGVSHQTVSRVVNEHASVAPETRAKVRRAIAELGYRPNTTARALARRRSGIIGVVSTDVGLYGPSSTLLAAEHAARDSGFFVSVASAQSGDAAGVRDAVERLLLQGVEAVVMIVPQVNADEVLAQLEPTLPIVVVEGRPQSRHPVVTIDQAGGACLVVEHLLSQGSPTVFHIGGPSTWREAHDRESGWRATLERAGVPTPEVLRGDWSAASGYAAGSQLAQNPEVRAIFVANDQMALGVLRALHEDGRDVPGDVLVAGYDDVPEAAYFSPPLTTIRQRFDEVGRRSIAILVSLLEDNDVPRVEIIPAELVVRQSSAPSPEHLRRNQ